MSKTLFEIAQLRQSFTQVTGELIKTYFPFNIIQTLRFQTGLVALKQKLGGGFNAYAVRSYEDLTSMMDRVRITTGDLMAAEEIVKARDPNGVLADVPPLGDIAVKLGLVDVKNKNLLMRAQGCVRILDMIDAIECRTFGKQPDLAMVVYDLRANPDCGKEGAEAVFARSFIGANSPKALMQIQALNHMMDIFVSLAAYISSKIDDVPINFGNLKPELDGIKNLVIDKLAEVGREFTDTSQVHTGAQQIFNQLLDISMPHRNKLEYDGFDFLAAQPNHALHDFADKVFKLARSYTAALQLETIADVRIDDLQKLMEQRSQQAEVGYASPSMGQFRQ